MTPSRLARIALAMTCVACLAPLGASAAVDAPALQGRAAAAAIAGTLDLAGELGAFHSTDDGIEATPDGGSAPAPAARVPPAHLGLSARLLHVETDVERYEATTFVAAPRQDVERQTFASVQGASQPARTGFSFFLAPLPGRDPPTVHANGIAATLGIDADGITEHQPRWVPTARPTLHSPEGPLVSVANDGLRALRIEGDFVLTLWEWDMMLSSPTSSALVVSGFTGQSYLPRLPEPVGDNVVGQDFEERQVFLYAEDAVLDVTLPVGAAAGISLLTVDGTVAGRVRLAAPEGIVATEAGPVALKDGDWVEGDLHLAAGPAQPASFAFAIGGEPTDARIGGRAATIASPQATTVSPLPWALGLGVAAVVAAAAVFVVRRRDGAQVAAIKRLMDVADYRAVVDRTTPRLLRLRRYGDSVRTQRAVAQLVLGRTEDAAQTLDGWTTGQEATRDYLWACVHAARGETAAAAKRLQSCMQRDPILARQLLADNLMGQVSGVRIAGGDAAAATPAADTRTEGYV